jgi:hypothetical protein
VALPDEVDLEEAAGRWGIPVVPGLLSRQELTSRLLAAMGDPAAVAHVARSLPRDATTIWLALRNDSSGTPMPLATVAETLNVDLAAPGGRHRYREALRALERSLLVWHTWREGTRWLFVPAEIRAPAPRPAPRAPGVVDGPAEIDAPATSFPLAWDLLTVLRALSDPDRPRPRAGQPFPAPWLRRLGRRLWRGGDDGPPTGYVPFLVALARGEELLAPEDGRTGPLVVTPRARQWRDLRFSEQAAHLRWRWLSANDWIEGADQHDTQIWGGDWRALRRKTLDALALLPAGAWHDLDTVARWVAERSPDLLGPTFTAAAGTRTDGDGPAARRAAAAAAAALTIQRPFAWFGLVELAVTDAHGIVVRSTPRGVAIAHGAPLPAEGGAPKVIVGEDGTITLHAPQPVQVWSVMAFADLVELNEPATYALTERSIERAIVAGFDTGQVGGFLRTQSGADLPPGVAAMLERERTDHAIVGVRDAVWLEPVDAATTDRVRSTLAAAGADVADAPGGGLLVTGEFADPDRLATLLRSNRFAPRVAATPAPATGDD